MENNRKRQLTIIIFVLLGALILLFGPPLATFSADLWLSSQGGEADSHLYNSVVSGYIDTYQILGSIILVISFITLLRSNKVI